MYVRTSEGVVKMWSFPLYIHRINNHIYFVIFLPKKNEIRAELDRTMLPPHNLSPSFAVRSNFEIFQPVTENEVKAVILKSKPTSCSLDPIPTPLLVESLDLLLPTITNIVNESLTSGSFPTLCKSAVIKPLLKKQGLDQNNLNNYRPVSNISFISKVIEKLVLKQLFAYLNDNTLLSPNQLAYSPSHSTETILFKITNDHLLALDSGKISILVLLDLSAAYDIVDH